MAPEISFTLSEQDCVDAARNQYRQRITSLRGLGWTIAFLTATSAFFTYLDASDLESALYTGAVYFALALFVVIFLLGCLYFSVGKHARRMYRQQVIHPESRMSWTDGGLQNHNEFGA